MSLLMKVVDLKSYLKNKHRFIDYFENPPFKSKNIHYISKRCFEIKASWRSIWTTPMAEIIRLCCIIFFVMPDEFK
jgi:hypothetical protein